MDCEWIGWCALKPEVQAAWAQAVFSVVGIAVAIYIPWRQRRHAIRDREALEANKVKVIAAAMAGAVGQYRGSLAAVRSFIPFSHEARQTIPATGIRRPIEFDQFRTDIFLLGPLGQRLNRLIATHLTLSGAAMALHTAKSLAPDIQKAMEEEFAEAVAEADRLIPLLQARARD